MATKKERLATLEIKYSQHEKVICTLQKDIVTIQKSVNDIQRAINNFVLEETEKRLLQMQKTEKGDVDV